MNFVEIMDGGFSTDQSHFRFREYDELILFADPTNKYYRMLTDVASNRFESGYNINLPSMEKYSLVDFLERETLICVSLQGKATIVDITGRVLASLRFEEVEGHYRAILSADKRNLIVFNYGQSKSEVFNILIKASHDSNIPYELTLGASKNLGDSQIEDAALFKIGERIVLVVAVRNQASLRIFNLDSDFEEIKGGIKTPDQIKHSRLATRGNRIVSISNENSLVTIVDN